MSQHARKLIEVALPLEAINHGAGVEAAPTPYGAVAMCVVRYVRRPFTREPDFGATSVNYDWRELWGRGTRPG